MKCLKTHSNFLSYVDTGSKVKQGSVLQRQSWPQPLGKDRSGGGATSSVPQEDGTML